MASKHRNGLSRLTDDVLDCFAVTRCRRILVILENNSTRMTGKTLAETLGAIEKDVLTTNLSADYISQIQTSLHHNHLPRLDAVGLIDWNRDRGTVRLEDHPVVSSPDFNQLLMRLKHESDEIAESIANEKRRAILGILQSKGRRLTVDMLVREISVRYSDTYLFDSTEAIRLQLHHRHLPRFDEAGIINYDDEDGKVSLRSNRLTAAVEDCIADGKIDPERTDTGPFFG